MSKLNDEVKSEIRRVIARSWKCKAFKLDGDYHTLDSILVGDKIEGHAAQRLAMLHIMDGEKTLDAHGEYVDLDMDTFKVGMLLAKNLGMPLCVVLVTNAGPYYTVIANKSDVADGDFVALNSTELSVRISVAGFRELDMSDGAS